MLAITLVISLVFIGHNTYEYTYDGGKLTSMVVNGEDVFYFFYDGNGKPMLFMYNGIKYFYATNLQGDVTAIVSVGGNEKVEYTYDAWGNILSVTGANAATIGRLNPLRYRGYVYDQPTGLYYLQSRYYDPNLGRFINADVYASTGQGLLGNNMFAYCGNNPVSRKDPTGNAFVQMSFDPTGISGMLTPGPWGGGSGGVGFAAGTFSSAKSSMQEETKELTYKSSDDENSTNVVDSYKVINPITMYMYIAEHRGNEISGSTTGVVVEWILHDIAYGAGWGLNSVGATGIGRKWMRQGKDLDIGSTIYDDDEHGALSVIMWGAYNIVAPISSKVDLFIEMFE